MEVTVSIDINAPIQRVYEAFTDLHMIADRISGIKNVEVLEDKGFKVGTRWRETRVMMGQEATEVMEVSQANPPSSYEVVAESRGTKYRSTYVFEENNGITTVTITFEGIPHSIGAKLTSLLGFLFKGQLKKMLLQDMRELKGFCEQAVG